MTARAHAVDVFAELTCPQCGIGELENEVENEQTVGACRRCHRRFPAFGGIACVVQDPNAWRSLWLGHLQEYREVTTLRIRQWQRERELPDQLPRTEQRLERLITAKTRELERITQLFAPLAQGAVTPALSTGEQASARLAVLHCYENIFRDWSWGAAESAKLVELIRPLLPKALGRLAVCGAGAGRFAADAHRTLRPTRTFALDLNPLPFLVAERLLRGETLELDEFPASPIGDEQAVVRQQLSWSDAVAPGFHLLFANALTPPFQPESLDVVLAPWFVDVCGADLKVTLAVMNRVLRQGGTFVQLGPLDFDTVLSQAYSFEEALELTEKSGFTVVASSRTELPYFDSPHSASRRIESVYVIVARKRARARAVSIASPLPAWVENPALPIPVSAELTKTGQKSMFSGMVLAQVDGQRSIRDLATMIAPSTSIDAATLEQELLRFFRKLLTP